MQADSAPELTLTPDGRVHPARHLASPNCDDYPQGAAPTLLVLHNISLPPGEYGGPGVEQLFGNTLNPDGHPYYAGIAHLRVSSHFFIRRDGELVQFVPVTRRAWHAGVSNYCGRERCNDFSLGVEMEGSDFEPFTDAQYRALNRLAALLARELPLTAVTGHQHIAPGRKTDPGPFFEWDRLDGKLPLWLGNTVAGSEYG
ncbi:1,6-anhydro-N-acetylmuramyl-L-alanine amidase AmpD [Crenobacter intestini]|uniref:1,6-anhydro-N-acetylmuramyl-L-alanine amidase AmpD n=1 Tax=Crenobacter intestini TaxID=2563443 RepID=A0A4T0UQR0_9NEIS|nr:1,6-anhydro-N-acetylmuramyl-L-alanine amidase AmpD [Crenobacter intestini]TIC81198.1 1,6-anhydro-N-acetylmuramyl-L-alanine amidase AmpD [Crenobacter intestini]